MLLPADHGSHSPHRVWWLCYNSPAEPKRRNGPIPRLKPRPPQPNWPKVLTEWCVIRALARSGWPQPLASASGERAAFVTEVGAYVRFHAVELPELEAESRVLAAVEHSYRQNGGSDFQTATTAVESTRSAYLIALAHSSAGAHSAPVQLAAQLRHSELRLDDYRRPLAATAQGAGRAAALAYWGAVSACRVPEGFFAAAPAGSAIVQMRARFDLWWALFLKTLNAVLRESNPSYCRLLEALPTLRAASQRRGQKFVLAALVQDWRQANAERFGLFNEIHFPVLERRAFAKAAWVEKWLETEASGYATDPAVREAAARALHAGLAEALASHRLPRWDN